MRKGEIPIGHIVAIILAIAVIGLIGWWLYTNYIKGENAGDTAECLGYKIAKCTGIPVDDERGKLCSNWQEFSPGSSECDKLLQKQEQPQP